MGSKFNYWNNRVIRKARRQGKHTLHHYDVHEVYYDKKGNPHSWTDKPLDLNGFDTVDDLRNSLAQILRDVLRFPVLEIKNNKLVERKRK